MNILKLIKELQDIADKEPTLEVWCHDGADPSDLGPVRVVLADYHWCPSDPHRRIVELWS